MKEKKEKKGKKEKKTRTETIFVFSAHSDDYVLGAGGTIAQYARQGKKVIAVVFSYGERSHPWLKPKVVQKMRSQEAQNASKLLGCNVLFFDLQEFHFLEDYQQQGKEQELLRLLQRYQPTKVFTHSNEDPHPDHQAVHKITQQVIGLLGKKPEVYIYSIWNPVSVRTAYPALYVDISSTFRTKLKALRTFRSQQLHIAYPFFLVLFRAVTEGWHLRKKAAEKFFRIS